MEPSSSGFNLYRFQQRRFPILLGWALGSIASGLFWMSSRKGALSAIGTQFAGWGAVNLILAVLGLRGARRNLQRQAQGEISPAEHARQVGNFELLVLINAVLDLVYIGFGAWLANTPTKKVEKHPGFRRGTGWGIAVQGLFLLFWDFLLVLLVRKGRKA